MTNLEALEKLYISLGGVESDLEGVNTTAEVIDLIKDVAGGGGSGEGGIPEIVLIWPDEGGEVFPVESGITPEDILNKAYRPACVCIIKAPTDEIIYNALMTYDIRSEAYFQMVFTWENPSSLVIYTVGFEVAENNEAVATWTRTGIPIG